MNSSSTPRDLILALLHGQSFAAVAPFVHSLKATGYRGRLVMFTSQVGAETEAELRRLGVQVMPFHFSGKKDRQPLARLWPLWRWYFASGASPAAKARLAHRVLHVRYRRYLLYAEFLRQREAEFDRVLLADSTDIFFQGDPFAWPWQPGVHFFLEEARNLLGNCRLHRLWLSCQVGPEFVDLHANEIVSCSGTTFGDTASIQDYLAEMVAAMMRARNLGKISGGDQGVHNYLRLENKVRNLILHPNRLGAVLTMGVMQPGEFQVDAAGKVLNEDGSVPPVLHQYDRLPELKQRLRSSLPALASAAPVQRG
jgi:hypothetical protein